MLKKKEITEIVRTDITWLVDGKPLRDFIRDLVVMERELTEKGYFNLVLEDNQFFDEVSFDIKGSRLETDEEVFERENKESIQKEKEYKLKYTNLKESGFLWEIFPDFDGVWENDKGVFINSITK